MRMTNAQLEEHLENLVDLEEDLEEHRDSQEELSAGYHWAQNAIGMLRDLMEYLGIRNPEPDEED